MSDHDHPRASDTAAFTKSHLGKSSNVSEDPMDLEEQKELKNTISSLHKSLSHKPVIKDEPPKGKTPPATNPSFEDEEQPLDLKTSSSAASAAGGVAGVATAASQVDEEQPLDLKKSSSAASAAGDLKQSSSAASAAGAAAVAVGGTAAIATVASRDSAAVGASTSQDSAVVATATSNDFQDEPLPPADSAASAGVAASTMKAAEEMPQKSGLVQINIAEPTIQQAPKAAAGRIFGMSRMAFGAVSLLALGGSGLAAWTGIKVADRQSQVDELESQVDRLSGQVNELAAENAEFKANNDMLNSSIYFFQEQNAELRNTSIRLAATAIQLNISIGVLQAQIPVLENVTETISIENDALNATNMALQEDVDTLNATVTALDEQNQALNATINELETNITVLGEENAQLNETEAQLNVLLNATIQVNDELNQNLQALDTTVQYLNASLTGSQEENLQHVSNLTQDILVNRNLGVEQLNLSYLDSYSNWDCIMGDKYTANFRNPTVILNITTLNQMLADMVTATGLVTQICLNNTNYQANLNYWHDIVTPKITTEQFVEQTDIYSNDALSYMFPNSPEACGIGNVTCLSHDQWEASNYTCAGITNAFLQYLWTVPSL